MLSPTVVAPRPVLNALAVKASTEPALAVVLPKNLEVATSAILANVTAPAAIVNAPSPDEVTSPL